MRAYKDAGPVALLISLDRQGQTRRVLVKKPSKHEAYDSAVVAALRNMSGMPPLPPEIKADGFEIERQFTMRDWCK